MFDVVGGVVVGSTGWDVQGLTARHIHTIHTQQRMMQQHTTIYIHTTTAAHSDWPAFQVARGVFT